MYLTPCDVYDRHVGLLVAVLGHRTVHLSGVAEREYNMTVENDKKRDQASCGNVSSARLKVNRAPVFNTA